MHRRLILLVGPSGVGKSSTYPLVESRFPHCIFEHLDGLAAKLGLAHGLIGSESIQLLRDRLEDDELFLAFGLEAVGRLAGQHLDHHLCIDVGAGFQDASSAKHLSRCHDVISILAEPEVAYRRKCERGQENRTFEAYKNKEFSRHRMQVYGQTPNRIDSTLHESPEVTAEALSEILAGLSQAHS